MYKHYSNAFIQLYAKLYLSTISQNYDEMYKIAKILNLEEFAKFLPLILLWKRSDMKLGENFPTDNKKLKKMRKEHRNGFGGLEKINALLKQMPENMMFIMRASNLIGLHNMVLGGNNRNRLVEFSRACIETLYGEFDLDAEYTHSNEELLKEAYEELKHFIV
jgi:aarF domain-containing kinase